MARRRRVLLAVLLLCGCLLVACGDRQTDGTTTGRPRFTIAFLRAVDSGQRENQAAFLGVLAEAGHRVDRDLTLLAADPTEVHADPADIDATVRGWVARGVDLIVALSTTGAAGARAAAPRVPVLFLSNDPVGGGLLRDVRRPEGRLTGVTFRVPPDRTLDFARRALPSATKIGLLYPPDDVAARAIKSDASRSADQLDIPLAEATFTGAADVGAAVEALRSQGAGALWALNSPTTFRFFPQIAAAGQAATLPAITNTAAEFAVVTLQPDVVELYRQLGRQALRLLDGDDVAVIPVEDPARFSFEVNLRAAAALGIEVPPAVVEAADRVVR